MESSARTLTTRDAVLLINHAAGDTVAGRTVMQKLAYFVSLWLELNLGHRAHFFGPFSVKVEDALENAVLAGELRETVERIADWSGGPDISMYTYELTTTGKERVDNLIENNSQEWDQVRGAVHAIKDVLPSLEQKTLSAAAKTHLIISESAGSIEVDKIPTLAKRLGWDLDRKQVQTTVKLLKQLHLVAEPK